jgi:flagellar hook-length control protein FliK
MDVSPRANLVGGTETPVSARNVSKREIVAEKKPDSETPSTGIAAGLVSQPVMQSMPMGINLGIQAASTPPVLPEAAAPVARAVVGLGRETHAEAWGDNTARMEPRPVAAEATPGLLWKNAGFASEKPTLEAASAAQGEVRGLSEISLKPQDTISLQNAVSLSMAEGEVNATVSVLSAPALSSAVTETDENLLDGKTLDGDTLFKAVRHENGSPVGGSPRNMKMDAKGETVLRELPSGVTVQNPAQSVTMGRHAASANAQTAYMQTANSQTPLAQTSANDRITLPERESDAEQRVENPVTAEVGKVVQKKEGFSFQENSNLNHDSESSGKEGGFAGNSVSAGSFDTVIKDRPEVMSEVSPEKELSALRENVLSQVRDKLANQEPVGNAGKISLKLNPRELGELQITVRLEDQKMSVDITAQNPLVKEALLQNIDQLKDTLLRQNISMQRFDVSAGTGQEQNLNQSFREGRQTAQHGSEDRSRQYARYYREESPVSQVAYGEAGASSLVDMRF